MAVGRDYFSSLAHQTLQKFLAHPPLASEAHRWNIRVSSGTTGKPPIIKVTELPLSAFKNFSGAERVVVCVGSQSSRLRNMLFARNSEGERAPHIICVDYRDMTESLTPLLKDFAPDTLSGFCSFVIRCARFLDPETASKVRVLKLFGERLTPQFQQYFAERFPQARIDMRYGGDVGRISAPPCGHLPPNVYHPKEGFVLQIKDPDKTGAGDLLVSTILNNTILVEQYEVGDVARIHSEPCACGVPLSFEILGRRGYDYVKVAGAILRQEEFDRVASLCKRVEDYRAEVSSLIADGDVRGKIKLTILTSDRDVSEDRKEEVRAIFYRELMLTPTQTLGDLVRKNIFVPLEIICVSNPFPQTHKGVRLIYREE